MRNHTVHDILLRRNLHLWHFTDSRNLDSIQARNAIYSHSELQRQGISAITGGNEQSLMADSMFGMDKFVHLCFTDAHPLEYLAKQDLRIIETRWLQINRDVLMIDGVCFTKGVSNKSQEKILTSEEAAATIDFVGIFEYLDFSMPENIQRKNSAKRGEILVPKEVPGKYIMGYHG